MTFAFTEDEINARHRARWAAATAEYGSTYDIPVSRQSEIDAACLKDWQDFVAERDGTTGAGSRRDKTKRLNRAIKDYVGSEVTVDLLAEETGAASSTVRQFIADNPGMFRKVGTGRWVAIDEVAERQRAKTTTSAVAAFLHALTGMPGKP